MKQLKSELILLSVNKSQQHSGTGDCQGKQEERGRVISLAQATLLAPGERLCGSGVCLLVNKNGRAGEQTVHLFHFRIAHRDQQMVLQLLIDLQTQGIKREREGEGQSSVCVTTLGQRTTSVSTSMLLRHLSPSPRVHGPTPQMVDL